jgi:uncharacterized protein
MSAISKVRMLFSYAIAVSSVACIFVTLSPSDVSAQSFDCSKASDAVEQAICTNSTLRDLDTKLGQTWKAYQIAHPEGVQLARAYGLTWYRQRKLCATSPDITGCIKSAEETRIAQLGGSVSQSSPVTATSKPDVSAPAKRERIGFGQHAGDDAEIIELTGVGSERATVKILMDWAQAENACSEEYLSYPGAAQNREGYNGCISYAKSTFKGPSTQTAWANCTTGEMQGFWMKPYNVTRFFRGMTVTNYPADPANKIEAYAEKDPVFEYEGFQVGNYSATNVEADAEIFRRLCPTSFMSPPKVDLPPLELDIDCKGEIEDAKITATQAGPGHLMNIKIIDAWDIKSEGTTWFRASCSAKILLNAGGEAVLKYAIVPRHGKYFLNASVVY